MCCSMDREHSSAGGHDEQIVRINAAIAVEEGAGSVSREQNRAKWDSTLAELPYIPVYYSSASIDYQLAYQRGHGGEWADLSLILHHDYRPCGVWPLSFSTKDSQRAITSHGLPVLPPLLVRDLPDRSRKTVIQKCIRLWEQICAAGDVAIRTSAESFADSAEMGLSEWLDQMLRAGAQASLRFELFVDLSLEADAIKSRFRKSYRSLITSGARDWLVGEMISANASLWLEFRRLHEQVSGRITRCAESWDLQHQAIADENAFLVFLRDRDGKMVGAGFFSTTRDECVYGVGAYDRSLFAKPLGHVVQYRAIEIMKSRNLRWYKIGQRPYSSEAPTEKALSIAEFKQGFATHLFPQYVLRHDRQTIGA
jgi:FemAB family protein